MPFAHVVLGLPVDRPFDYSIPDELSARCRPGCRVKVNFRGATLTGYVVAVADTTALNGVKPLTALLDEEPVISPMLLALTETLSRYYCCSWGEMIETAIPEGWRKGRKIAALPPYPRVESGVAGTDIRILQSEPQVRWQQYLSLIGQAYATGKKAIVLLPDSGALHAGRDLIERSVKDISVGILYRKQPRESAEWKKTASGGYDVILGTRSAVFAPLRNVGVIIVDDEQDYGYKQDQVPHYHCRVAAMERARLERCPVVFGSAAPSLELVKLVRENTATLTSHPSEKPPAITVIDTTRLPYGIVSRVFFSKYLQDAIAATLAVGGTSLVFLNRRGFATTASCNTCGAVLKCPRCSTNLVYHFRQQQLACGYCAFRMAAPRLCPSCNSGYIKFTGSGTEKIENELARLFPKARLASVSREEQIDKTKADIFVSTQSILSHPGVSFDLTAVLYLDNSLNHADFRATEKAYGLLTGLAGLTRKQLVIQTTVPRHYAVQALEKNDPAFFYTQELSLREQLAFPPFRHFAYIKVRGTREENAREAADEIYASVAKAAGASFTAIAPTPGQPPRLRENYYFVILVSGANPFDLSAFIKNCVHDFRRSGIIVTVDVDPL